MIGRVYAIVPAAGSGTRMGLGYSKAFVDLEGVPLMVRTLRALFRSPLVDRVTVAVRPEELGFCEREIIAGGGFSDRVAVIGGGAQRQQTVLKLLDEAPADCDLVLIHDGARPFVKPSLIREVLEGAREWGAAVAGLEMSDTVKESDDGGVTVQRTLERARLYRVQTPQAFHRDLILAAHRRAGEERWQATDDAALVERSGGIVRIVRGDTWNIKLTTPQDLEMARWILRSGVLGDHEDAAGEKREDR